MERGLFITFEGGDGSGKSRQLRLLVEELQEHENIGFRCYREPGGTELGDVMREALLYPLTNDPIPAQSEFLHFASSRSLLVTRHVRPDLKKGRVVLVDRYTDSSESYQGSGRGLSLEYIREVNRIATGGLVPDLTVLYDLDPKSALNRLSGDKDRIEAEGLEFHKRVRKGYLKLAAENPKRFEVINANRSVEAIYTDTREVVFEKIRGWGNWTFDF